MKAFSRLLIAALGAAAFASCTQNGNLIYLNIQKVTKTNTSSTIPLTITVTSIVKAVGSANSAAPYYVAAGKIYNGTVPSNGSTDWSPIGVPQASGNDMLCTALAWDGKYLWGGFFSSNGSTYGLYQMDLTVAGSTWSQVTDTQHPNMQVTYLTYANGNLFAVVSSMVSGNPTYQLDAYDTTAKTWTSTSLTSNTKPITGVAYVGTTYYACSGNILYSSTDFSFGTQVLSPASPVQTDSNDIMRGIFVDTSYSGGTLIVVPTSNQTTQTTGVGNLYYSMDGGASWTKTNTNNNTSYNVGFLCVAGPVDSAHTTYLLGTDSGLGGAFGFFAFIPSTNTLNRYSGISYSLYASAVNQILVDTANNLVAMGTINNGLWLTIGVDPTGGFGSSTWTQE